MLSQSQINKFHEDGFLIVEGFYDLELINDIRNAIHKIIDIIIDHNELDIKKSSFCPNDFDDAYLKLLNLDRNYGSLIYDAVKQIPAFNRLVNCEKNQKLFSLLRPKSLPSVAAAGHGIRINNPSEGRYLAPWHQEYPAQLRSVNGMVFWSPLYDLKLENGPVVVAKSSHKGGLLPVYFDGSATDVYALKIHKIKSILEKYELVQPILKAGDLIVMDFCTVHRSGQNQSNRALWSMQFRWFDMLEQTGVKNGWQGSFAAGSKFQDLHPELLVGDVNSNN
jgi:ectoine hydroxylase-related dioxygenase (phytanoyl-CoA dioxygenase family)